MFAFRNKKKYAVLVLMLMTLSFISFSVVTASRFAIQGPSLTVTLKDPRYETSDSNRRGYSNYFSDDLSELEFEREEGEKEDFNRRKGKHDKDKHKEQEEESILRRIVGISGLHPSVTWGIQSMGSPFPKLIPFLKSMSLKSHYQYDRHRHVHASVSDGGGEESAGNYVEGNIRLGTFFEGKGDVMLQFNPSYRLDEKKASLVIAVGTSGATNTRGGNSGNGFFGLVRFASKGKKLLEYARVSYKTDLPSTTVSSLTITPSFDFTNLLPTCIIEGESGTGRTNAILDLNLEDSTLTVIHALDAYNTIAPEISLHTAKIMYHWDVSISSGGHIRTRVDPTSAIQVTWTDQSMEGGKWVTDFKLPLDGGMGDLGAGGSGNAGVRTGIFAADIRVRRQFHF